MKGKIILINNEYELYNYSIDEVPEYGYCITINTELEKNFNELINEENVLNESIDDTVEYLKTSDSEYAEEQIKFYEDVKQRQDELLKNAEYIEFFFDIDSVVKYLNDNKELKSKKIILNEECELSYENLKKYESIFGEFSENLYFELTGNKKLISLSDCMSTYKILEEQAKEIEKLNFSPLEKIMYVYDIVRNKVYTKEEQGEDDTVSRDLSSSLLGEKIVCLGYARIFNALLEKVGINSKEIYLYNDTSGHARNEIYIKDDKYNVDGVYYFDTTWDSKKTNDDNNYLLSYKYFAMTKSKMDSIDGNRIKQNNFSYFSEDMAWEIEDIINTSGIESVPQEMVKSLKHMANIIGTSYTLKMLNAFHSLSPYYGKKTSEELASEIMEIVEYFIKPLSAETLLEVLYNVRKKQYYSNPEKYQFSLNDFYKIVLVSEWNFEKNAEFDLLDAIFGTNNSNSKKDRIVNYARKTGLFKNIEQVKLTRTLKKIYDEKTKKEQF